MGHSIEAFLLEDRVSDRQYLIMDDDFRVQMGGDRKREPNVHGTGIILHREAIRRLLVANAERRTPNAKRQTPNAKRQTPNAKRQRERARETR